MTVNKLSENRVLIVLCEQDIRNIHGIDFDTTAARSRVLGLTRRACRSSGIDTNGKRVNIEALPLEKSCYLLVTVGVSKRYRLKNHCPGLCWKIETCGSFMSAVEQLYRANVRCAKNSAYTKGGEYFLIFDYPAIPAKLGKILSEYGEKLNGRFSAVRIKETAKPICERNAVEIIGKKFI